MHEELGARGVRLLVDRADSACAAGRYTEALSALGQTVEAAARLDDPLLMVRALDIEGNALRMLGDAPGALARYTRVLGLAEDPATRDRLDHPDAARAVARAHWNWVSCAEYLTSIPVRDLFGALDAAERWLIDAGHRDWRAAVLLKRAALHARLGEREEAVSQSREALTLRLRHPDAPGYTLAAHRWNLGDKLRDAGRAAEAAPHYQAILDDPASGQWDRSTAHRGLAGCALTAGDPATARREAERAVQLAEPLGDDALCIALDILARACRAENDLDAAWEASVRHLEAADRIGGHVRPYYAARNAADIAIDRADHAAASRILDDLHTHARAMDDSTGTSIYSSELARRRRRLERPGRTV